MCTDEIEWHGVEYSGWFCWTQRSGSSSIVFFCFFFPFYIATDGIRVRGGLLLSPCSSLLCSLWSRCPQSIRHRTGDCLHKQNLNPGRSLSLSHRHCMKICTPLFRHGKGQPSTIPFAFFNSQHTSKDDTGKNATELPRTSPWFHFFFFFFFIVAFCVLFIKNNNGLLSLCLAASQAGTIRGRVIGRTGWGICWRRHGP